MTALIRQLHTYAGLLTFLNLMVYGAAGLAKAIPASEPKAVARDLPFTLPANATDREVAQRAVTRLGLTLVTPVHDFVIQHDSVGALWLDLRHVNGRHRVTFNEGLGIMHVEELRNTFPAYLSILHATTGAFRSGDRRLQLWAYYNEFAMWSLLAMLVSGTWLWLSTRASHRWAQASFAAGTAGFVILWLMVR